MAGKYTSLKTIRKAAEIISDQFLGPIASLALRAQMI
jgi:hypothetical protein